MEETEFSSANVVLKEYALPNIILLCFYTLLHIGLAFVPVITIVDGSRDLQSPIAAYIIGGVLSLMLLTSYTIGLCYFILTIKYKNILCSEDEIYIRYGDRWIVKIKYSEIAEYGDVYFSDNSLMLKKVSILNEVSK